MLLRWMSLALWALVAATAVAWGLKLMVSPTPVPTLARQADTTPPLQADLTRLLGADPVAAVAAEGSAEALSDSRFSLIGVVAPRQAGAQAAGEGVALIAIDGKPPRAFRVGSAVEGDQVLQSVSARGAELGPRGGPARVALNLPPLPAAATGSLPSLAPSPATTAPVPGAPVPLRRP